MLAFMFGSGLYLSIGIILNFQKLALTLKQDGGSSVHKVSVEGDGKKYQFQSNYLIGQIISIVVILSMLLFHVIMTIIMIFKLNIFGRYSKYLCAWSIFFVGLFSHLHFTIQKDEIFSIIIALYFVLPLSIQALHLNNLILTLGTYFAVQVYPVYMLVTSDYLNFDKGQQIKALLLIISHWIFLGISLTCNQRNNFELLMERQNVASVKREYNQILEQMPEGILIISNRGKIEFMNEELRDVLNVEIAGQEKQGLYVKMFKSYNIEDDIDNQKEDDCVSDCIHTIVEDEGWEEDEDRFFELDICGCETTRDEDRIFTQIRKLKIEFKEQPATMLLIRNITHIIKYEKSKTQGKYQELLTATTSHEMLTPLNSIINLSYFMESKLKKLLGNHRQRFAEEMQSLQRKRQQLQILVQQAAANADVTEDMRRKMINDQRNEKTDTLMKSPSMDLSDMEQLLLKSPKLHQKMLMQNNALAEKDFSDSFEYQHVIKSSAKILQFIVKDLIDLMNIKGGNFNPQVTNANYTALQESCQEIIDCYRVQARDKNIFLRLTMVNDDRVNNRLSGISFDKQRYQQILLNLVQNGVKFTATGGVELIVEVELSGGSQALSNNSRHIYNNGFIKQSSNLAVKPLNAHQKALQSSPKEDKEHETNANGGGQQISPQNSNPIHGHHPSCDQCGVIVTRVKDTGVGMRKEVVEKLFKLFALAQKSNALSKGGIITTQGIGLGLSISKQLVEILGGIIRINTAPNQGTEVRFVIPFMCASCLNLFQGNQMIGSTNSNMMRAIKRSKGQISNVFRSFIVQDSMDYKSDNTSLTPGVLGDGNALIGATGGPAGGIAPNQPPSPSTLRSWQPFGGDINFLANHNEKTASAINAGGMHGVASPKIQTSSGGSSKIKEQKKKQYQIIQQCSMRKKKNTGAESLFEIFGDKAPLSNANGTGGQSIYNDQKQRDDQFFFQSQDSYITSDPQVSQRNINQIQDNGFVVNNQEVFGDNLGDSIHHNDEISQLRKKNLDQKLMGMIGDFEAMSMNYSERRKTGSMNNTITDYQNINITQKVALQSYKNPSQTNPKNLPSQNQNRRQKSNNDVDDIQNTMFCNKTVGSGGNSKKAYEFSKFKKNSNQKFPEEGFDQRQYLVFHGSSDMSGSAGVLWSPKEVSINDEISTSRDYLLSPIGHRDRDKMPNDLKIVGSSQRRQPIDHNDIQMILHLEQNHTSNAMTKHRLIFRKQENLVDLGIGASEDVLKVPETSILSLQEQQAKHDSTKSQNTLQPFPPIDYHQKHAAPYVKPQIGVFISDTDTENAHYKEPVNGVIISDGSLLNNPNMHLNYNANHMMPSGVQETGVLDFDQEKKQTAYFAAGDSHCNEDGESRINTHTNFSRKSTLNKKPNINLLFQGGGAAGILLTNQQNEFSSLDIGQPSFKSQSCTNNNNLFKSTSLKNKLQQDASYPDNSKNSGQEDQPINVAMMQQASQDLSKSTLKEIAMFNNNTAGQTKGAEIHKSSIHLIQNGILQDIGGSGKGQLLQSTDYQGSLGLQNPSTFKHSKQGGLGGQLMINNALSTLLEVAGAEEAEEEVKVSSANYLRSLKNNHENALADKVSPFTLYNPNASPKNYQDERIDGFLQGMPSKLKPLKYNSVAEGFLENSIQVREFCGSQKNSAPEESNRQNNQPLLDHDYRDNGLLLGEQEMGQASSRRIAKVDRQHQQSIRRSEESQASRGLLSTGKEKTQGISRGLGQYCQCPTISLNLGSQQTEQNCQIMIVDDNTFNLMPLELILGSLNGLQCHKAFNGLEAVNLFKKSLTSHIHERKLTQSQECCYECGLVIRGSHGQIEGNPAHQKFPQYKLILMDLNMPIMDGFEATKQIYQLYNQWKKDNAHLTFQGGLTTDEYHLSVVAVTAFVNDESIRCCYEVGMQDVLHKPVNTLDIKRILDKYYYRIGQGSHSQKSSINNKVIQGGYPGGY